MKAVAATVSGGRVVRTRPLAEHELEAQAELEVRKAKADGTGLRYKRRGWGVLLDLEPERVRICDGCPYAYRASCHSPGCRHAGADGPGHGHLSAMIRYGYCPDGRFGDEQ